MRRCLSNKKQLFGPIYPRDSTDVGIFGAVALTDANIKIFADTTSDFTKSEIARRRELTNAYRP